MECEPDVSLLTCTFYLFIFTRSLIMVRHHSQNYAKCILRSHHRFQEYKTLFSGKLHFFLFFSFFLFLFAVSGILLGRSVSESCQVLPRCSVFGTLPGRIFIMPAFFIHIFSNSFLCVKPFFLLSQKLPWLISYLLVFYF